MKYPLVIVEGCDGSGKSTLISQLAQVPGIPYIWRIAASRRPKTREEVDDMTTAVEFIVHGDPHFYAPIPIVLDRHAYISEPIYGTVVRDKPVVFWDEIEQIPSLLLRPSVLVVYCRPDIEVIRCEIKRNPQMEGVVPKLDEIVRQYDLRMSLLIAGGVRVYAYDWTHQGPIEFWQKVYGDCLQ